MCVGNVERSEEKREIEENERGREMEVRKESERGKSIVTRVGLFAGWPELIITDGYQLVNSDTPLRASPTVLFVSVCAPQERERERNAKPEISTLDNQEREPPHSTNVSFQGTNLPPYTKPSYMRFSQKTS